MKGTDIDSGEVPSCRSGGTSVTGRECAAVLAGLASGARERVSLGLVDLVPNQLHHDRRIPIVLADGAMLAVQGAVARALYEVYRGRQSPGDLPKHLRYRIVRQLAAAGADGHAVLRGIATAGACEETRRSGLHVELLEVPAAAIAFAGRYEPLTSVNDAMFRLLRGTPRTRHLGTFSQLAIELSVLTEHPNKTYDTLTSASTGFRSGELTDADLGTIEVVSEAAALVRADPGTYRVSGYSLGDQGWLLMVRSI